MSPDLPVLLVHGAAAVQATAHFAHSGAVDARGGTHGRFAPSWWRSRWLFFLLLASALWLGQRDALRANFQIWNPDESQLIAGAIVLTERPVFWRDVDGTTHGPLAQYPLLAAATVGAPLDYTTARAVGLVVIALLLIALHATLATWLQDSAARLLVLPAWTWLTFNQDPELAQYGSELMPCLLLTLAAWPAILWVEPGLRTGWFAHRPALLTFLCGLLAGAAPFAKLQAAPLAAWIIASVLLSLLRTAGASRTRLSVTLLAGAAAPASLFSGLTVAAGAWDDFWIRYLTVNLRGYVAEGATWFNSAPPTPDLIFGFSAFLWPLLISILAAACWLVSHRARPSPPLLTFTLGLAACAAFAIYAPRKPFGHYFIFALTPLVLLLGALAAPLFQRWRETPAFRRGLLAVLALLILAGPLTAHHFRHPGYFRSVVAQRPPIPRELIESVQRHTEPGDGLAVWGWQPGLYVFSQTVSSTPDLIVFWQIVPSPWRAFYRERYLRDFIARPPDVFVDTTGPADFFFFRRVDEARHETFSALRDLIARDYTLVETAAGARVYVRVNRAAPAAKGL